MKSSHSLKLKISTLLLLVIITLTACTRLRVELDTTNNDLTEIIARQIEFLDPDMILDSGITIGAAKVEIESVRNYLRSYLFSYDYYNEELGANLVNKITGIFAEELGTSLQELDKLRVGQLTESMRQARDKIKKNEKDFIHKVHSRIIKENMDTWFKGREFQGYVGNNRNYEWYINQHMTGEYSDINCMPTCAVMALKWTNRDFNQTVEDARKEFHVGGLGWYPSDAEKYFDSKGLNYSRLHFNIGDKAGGITGLKNVIDSGGIAIICIMTNDIPLQEDILCRINSEYHNDENQAHAIIVKGYMKMDDKIYFEIYDPDGSSSYIDTGSPVGKNRFYDADSLMNASFNWWDKTYAIVIPQQ